MDRDLTGETQNGDAWKMSTETPRERFERVIRPRVEKAQHAIDLIGNGAARDYETTRDEIAALLNPLQQQLWEIQRRYADRLGCSTDIFDQCENIREDEPQYDGDPPDQATPSGGSDAEVLKATISGLRWGHVPMLVAAVPETLLAPVITQLVHRALGVVETREGGS